jgi:RNA-directed DNA polymerase
MMRRPHRQARCKVEIKRAQEFARRFPYFLKLDVRRFFETADHRVLKALLQRLVKDKRALSLCDEFIDAGAPGSAVGKGLPIGNLTSQHFANLYLGPLDHFIKETLRVRGYCRYMDDHLFFVHGRDEPAAIHDKVAACMNERLLLEIKERVTESGPVSIGVPFLGFRIWPQLIRLDGYRARRFRTRIRNRTLQLNADEIDEESWARSMTSLCGWAEQADTYHFRSSFFNRLRRDGMLPS